MYDNTEYEYLMKQLTDMSYDNVRGVREFITKMVHIQTKLKSHQIDLNEKSIVKHALNSLPLIAHKLKLPTIPLVRNGLSLTLLPSVLLKKRNSRKKKVT